jgi:glycosyltransferase involved in cell wall biosynthesis
VQTVSVVIPAFNRAREIPGVIATVLSQTYPAREIILIDDGSTDDTPQVVDSVPGPVRYIRQENQGVAAARNRGIQEATGDLVAFLDTDDRWHPRKLEIQTALMGSRSGVGWTATGIDIISQSGDGRTRGGLQQGVPVFKEIGRTPADWFAETLDREMLAVDGLDVEAFVGDAYGLLLNGNFIFPSSVTVRRALLERVGAFDPTYPKAEETEFFLRLAARSPFAMVLMPLTAYHIGASDALTAPDHTVELTELALRAVRRAIDERPPVSEFERRSAERGQRNLLLRQAYAYLSNLDLEQVRVSIRRARDMGLPLGPKGTAYSVLARIPVGMLRGLSRARSAVRKLVR